MQPGDELDDLDLYDKQAADIRRQLHNINLDEWCRDLKDLDKDLFDKIYHNLFKLHNTR